MALSLALLLLSYIVTAIGYEVTSDKSSGHVPVSSQVQKVPRIPSTRLKRKEPQVDIGTTVPGSQILRKGKAME